MRYARYLRYEKYIAASDTGGIIERWKYGRRLLEDGTATTPAGNLRHGVLDRLLAHATARGYKLSKSEIHRRMQCAKAYQTEAQISRAAGDFKQWWALVSAGFPPVEVADDGEPYDPRDADEKWRDTKRQLKDSAGNPETSGQCALFDLLDLPGITRDTAGPESKLRDLQKMHQYLRDEVTPDLRRAAQQAEADDRVRDVRLRRLVDAVGGDLDATWGDASRIVLAND